MFFMDVWKSFDLFVEKGYAIFKIIVPVLSKIKTNWTEAKLTADWSSLAHIRNFCNSKYDRWFEDFLSIQTTHLSIKKEIKI